MRFGYEPKRLLAAGAANDAGVTRGTDASVRDATVAVSTSDAAQPAPPVTAADASSPQVAEHDDSGVQPPTDSGSPDAGPTSLGSCSFSITTNAYVGNPHYHGTLDLKNTGATAWTLPTIDFHLPSSAYMCNDAQALPGAGWTLTISGNHCTYTRTAPPLAIAPGATLSFEYSSNDPMSAASGSAAANVSVSGCM